MERRYSQQQHTIKNALHCLDHPTAADVYGEVRKTLPSISLGTVYRNINRLVDDGVILRVSTPGEADRFDACVDEHIHVTCMRCGHVVDAEGEDVLSSLHELVEAIGATSGIRIDEHALSFSGLCSDCQESEEAAALQTKR